MARVIPHQIGFNCPSFGEGEAFQQLRDDPSANSWAVLDSLDTSNHLKQISGGIDFLVTVPGKGALGSGVKSYTRREKENRVEYCSI